MLLAAALAPAALKGVSLAAGGDLAKGCAEIILSPPVLLANRGQVLLLFLFPGQSPPET